MLQDFKYGGMADKYFVRISTKSSIYNRMFIFRILM